MPPKNLRIQWPAKASLQLLSLRPHARFTAPPKKLLDQSLAYFSPAATPSLPYGNWGRLDQRPGKRSGSWPARSNRSWDRPGGGREARVRDRDRATPPSHPSPVRKRPLCRCQGNPGPPKTPPSSALTSAPPRSSRTVARSMSARKQMLLIPPRCAWEP